MADRPSSFPRFPVVIHHNPDCGTSRNVLATIEAAGYAPVVVEYLKVGWTRPHLLSLLAAMGLGPRDVLREKGTPAAELGLLAEGVDNDALLDAMVKRRPGQPAHRGHAEGRRPVPTVRGGVRPVGADARGLH